MCVPSVIIGSPQEPLDYGHVKAAWAGLRPLVRDPNADPEDTKKVRTEIEHLMPHRSDLCAPLQ